MTDIVEVKQGELSIYEPEQGLKSIAVAEAAIKYYARAKDIEQLFEAVELKLKEQRKFVRWWDGLGEKRGNPTKRNRSVTFPVAGRDGMPERMVIKRWRDATTDEQYAKTLKEVQEQCRAICERDKGGPVRGTSGTGENEWFTPEQYIKMVRDVLGAIDLDPATHPEAQKIIKASEFYTKTDNGLEREWHGRVWLNPPYAQPLIAHFINKLIDEWRAGRILSAIVLTHNYTDTEWFQVLAKESCSICFTRGRVKFYEPDGTIAQPTQGQAFTYLGDNIGLFWAVFADVGFELIVSDHFKRLGFAAPENLNPFMFSGQKTAQ